jgi:predicted TIM-barrel fold metal-dependent hydrolase
MAPEGPVQQDVQVGGVRHWEGPVVDCDVHAVPASLDVLGPYLDDVWWRFLAGRGWQGPIGPQITYPPGYPATCRADWLPQDGRPPASAVDLVRRHILDATGVDRAVVSCYYGVDSVRHPDLGPAIARAVNDWLVAEWLQCDERLAGSITVAGRNPRAMADEIDRLGGHPQMVQVLVPVRSATLYGQRHWYPLYEAIVRNDLVMGLHWGGTLESAPSPTGWPSWYVEEYAAEVQMYAAQITSMVAEGIFQAFPTLRVSVLEAGFAWLPVWWWRLDKDWKGLRREIPWVTEPPSQVLRRHVRLSTSPLDVSEPRLMSAVLEWLNSDDLLMFASDYPHWHEDDIELLLGAASTDARGKIMSGNARTWYRLE